jgi:hypothetical protein
MLIALNDDFGERPPWRRLFKAVHDLPSEHELLIQLRFFSALPLSGVAERAGLGGPAAARIEIPPLRLAAADRRETFG